MTSPDWSKERGAHWRAELSGIEATLAPVDAPLIAALRIDTAHRVADLGCGGGGTTLELRRRAPKGCIVHGYDISPDLIDAARGRSDGGITFQVADLARATPDAPYDRLVSRFGMMFFHDPARAFANIAQWLAPGGRFAFAVWAPLRDNAWMSLLREEAARFVTIPPQEPDAPGPFRYGDVAPLIALLSHAGLREIEARPWRGALPMGGAIPTADAAELALASFGPFAQLFAEAGDGARRQARSALAKRFEEHVQDGAVRLDALVHIVTGTR